MQYFGGKSKIRKELAAYINSLKPLNYLEPFCGSCWVGEVVTAPIKVFSDVNPDLIALWQAVQTGWLPPSLVSETDYRICRELSSPSALKGFVGFACSFAGKWFGGYARDGKGEKGGNYALRGYNQFLKRRGNFEASIFEHTSYQTQMLRKFDVIYCDPPYENTTSYKGVPKMNYAEFWETCRRASCGGATVLVSSYEAPPDFHTVLEIVTKTQIRDKNGLVIPRIEKVFGFKPYKNVTKLPPETSLFTGTLSAQDQA